MNTSKFAELARREIQENIIEHLEQENLEEYLLDLAKGCVAYLGWHYAASFEIVYTDSRTHMKQRAIWVGIDFTDINVEDASAISNIKARIADHDWVAWAEQNPQLASEMLTRLESFYLN